MIFSLSSTKHKFENTQKVFKPSTTDGVPFNSTLLQKWFPAYDFQKTNRKCADTGSSARDDSEVWNDGTSFHQK